MTTSPSLQQGVAVIKSHIERLPMDPGVYRMIDGEGGVLYVGKARRLAARAVNYTRPEHLPYRLQHMIALTRDMIFSTTENDAEALLLEARLIKEYAPRFNIMLRDDKSYPYICVETGHDYPRIRLHRGKKNKRSRYFGPYPSAGDARETITAVQRGFKLRPCRDSYFAARERPCLEYQIKRCSAPCVNNISKEEYAASVRDALGVLEGKNRSLQDALREQMEEASADMRYEKALELRERIRAVGKIQDTRPAAAGLPPETHVIGAASGNGVACVNIVMYKEGCRNGNFPVFSDIEENENIADMLEETLSRFYADNPIPDEIILPAALPDPDIAPIFSELRGKKTVLHVPVRGVKKKLLELASKDADIRHAHKSGEIAKRSQQLTQVADFFGIEKAIKRIEIYDNSHIAGTFPVGVYVTAGPDGFVKSQYRRFTIKDNTVVPGDDYGMMREVMTRRLRRLKQEHPSYTPGVWPDLLLIDGGKGQLSAVMEILLQENIRPEQIACVAVSKGPDRNAGREQFHMAGQETRQLPLNDPLLHYLQILRDEAHRFAIGSHRQKRAKSMSGSALDDIPGVGPARRKALLAFFGSVRTLKDASVENIAKVEGVNAALAQRIYDYFH